MSATMRLSSPGDKAKAGGAGGSALRPRTGVEEEGVIGKNER